MDLNTITITGRLTRDPELRYLPSGAAVANFTIASQSIRRKGQDGKSNFEPLFIDVKVFGQQGEACGQYLTKGQAIGITGSLGLDQWMSQDGQKRQRMYVLARDIQFGAKPRGAQGSPQAESPQPAYAEQGDEHDAYYGQ